MNKENQKAYLIGAGIAYLRSANQWKVPDVPWIPYFFLHKGSI